MVNQQQPMALEEIVALLQSRAANGEYPEGKRLPPERTLAAELGVGRAAVRTALDRLDERGVIARAPGRRPWVRQKPKASTVPHRPGSRIQALKTIAAILPQNPLYPAALSILRGINRVLRERDVPYRLVVFDTQAGANSGEQERHALRAALEEGIEGVILWHLCGEETLPEVLALREHGRPIVFVDRYPESLDCDFVGVDNHAAASEAVRHLLAAGHQRIAHLTERSMIGPVVERRAGYQEAMEAAGLPVDESRIMIADDSEGAEWEAAVDRLLAMAPPPTAVFAVNDSYAHALAAALPLRGLRVPDDVSIVGFDNLERYSPRPAMLTTVHQPFDRMGRRAADLLLRRLASGIQPQRTFVHALLPTTVIRRETTAGPEASCFNTCPYPSEEELLPGA